jgi:hypothetical protein
MCASAAHYGIVEPSASQCARAMLYQDGSHLCSTLSPEKVLKVGPGGKYQSPSPWHQSPLSLGPVLSRFLVFQLVGCLLKNSQNSPLSSPLPSPLAPAPYYIIDWLNLFTKAASWHLQQMLYPDRKFDLKAINIKPLNIQWCNKHVLLHTDDSHKQDSNIFHKEYTVFFNG